MKDIPDYIHEIKGMKDYEDNWRHGLSTGDIFFTKEKKISSHLFSCRSPFAHVGFVLCEGSRILGFDSTKQGTRNGVSIFNFSNLFLSSKSRVYVMRHILSKEQKKSLISLSHTLCHVPYQNKPWRLAKFYFGKNPNADDSGSLFCSELVIHCLKEMEVITCDSIKPHHYHPKHIAYLSRGLERFLFPY